MLRKQKFKLLCYNRFHLPTRIVLLPAFLNQGFYFYTGRKIERLVISSFFMCFFQVADFFLTKRLGSSIHTKKTKSKKKK